MPVISKADYLMGYTPPVLGWVVGTDTNVGKTHVTGCLYRESRSKGFPILTQKWVQTGCECDIDEHDRLAGVVGDGALRGYRMPYQFDPPVSPHWAAKLAGDSIEWGVIGQALTQLRQGHHVLIEGSGGVMVPLAVGQLMIDYMAKVGGEVVLVVPNRVGALNHTHLTMEALHTRGISVGTLILNGGVVPDSLTGVRQENLDYCATMWPDSSVVDWG